MVDTFFKGQLLWVNMLIVTDSISLILPPKLVHIIYSKCVFFSIKKNFSAQFLFQMDTGNTIGKLSLSC